MHALFEIMHSLFDIMHSLYDIINALYITMLLIYQIICNRFLITHALFIYNATLVLMLEFIVCI